MKRNEILNVFSILNQMESINRFSRDRLINEENVLQHTGWVCVWSYFVANQIDQQFDEINIDYGKLFRGAVTHDIEEVRTGDIPRITKYATPEILNSIKEWENISILEIGNAMEDVNLFIDWKHAKGDKTIEQSIVKIADIAAVVYKLWDEIVRLNNFSMMRVADELQDVIEREGRLLEAIKMPTAPKISDYLIKLNENLGELVREIRNVSKNGPLVNTLKYGDTNEDKKSTD